MQPYGRLPPDSDIVAIKGRRAAANIHSENFQRQITTFSKSHAGRTLIAAMQLRGRMGHNML